MRQSEALAQLARETDRARRNLALERFARAGFWSVFAAGVWAALALFGLHERLPLLGQSLTAIAALCGLGWLAWRGARRWRAPTDDEARAQLAADAKLDAGAFDALRDQPSRYDPLSLALWRRAQDQAVACAEHLHAAPVRLRLQRTDRFRLRYVLAAVLVVGLIFARSDAGERLARAFIPDPGPLVGDGEMAVEAWVTPADYTHAAPISLSDLVGQTVATPPSVEAVVRVTGPVAAPRLVFEGSSGKRSVPFVRGADGAWEARMPVPGAGRLKVVRFHTRAAWRLTPALDNTPRAWFAAPIASLHDEVVGLSWRASDDYGVRRLALRVRPLNPPAGLTRADAVDTELESPAGDPQQAEASAEIDLASHPYAGLEVEAQIVALDALGQEGASNPLRFTMPEKVFLQPLARAAIEIRRHVLAERRPYRGERPAWGWLAELSPGQTPAYSDEDSLARAPEGVRRAARLTDALTTAPQDGYFRDLAVFVGLRLARSELTVARRIEDTNAAADTLWRTALRAEYGGAADARAALEEAQRQLAEALAAGAPPERMQQLFEALRRATDNYMQALVQEAIRNGEQANLDDTQDQTQISGRDIEDLLNQAQQLSQQGRRAEAQQLLDMLAGILQNLDVQLSQSQSGDGEGQGEQDRRLQQRMDQLSDSIGDQRTLNDETRQQQQRGQSGQDGSAQELADRQASIRQGLAEAQSQSGGAAPSEDLNAASEAMRRAEDALRRDDLRSAQAAQDTALENLRQGAEALAAQMRGRDQQGERTPRSNASDDPLGRPTANGDSGADSQTPVQSDPVRARQIRDDILRRAQDPNRPESERDYLRRLLDRFGGS